MQQYLDKFLGKMVKDLTTGFIGVATAAHQMYNGNVQISVSPKSHDPSKMEESWGIDVHNLVVLDEELVVPNLAKTSIKLSIGDEATHKITGIKGTITSVNYYLNGCISAFVVNKKESNWYFQEFLEVTKKTKTPAPKTSTGCAPQRVVRM